MTDRHLGNPTLTRRSVLGGAVALGAGGVLATGIPAQAAESIGIEGQIDALAGRLDADLIALRRDIHRHPELAGGEVHTAALVADRLRAAGLEVTTGVGGHGVVGVLRGKGRGRTVAYRADMDAVPPDSQINGGPDPAHVCGHDLHTTIGVGVAEVLARLRTRLHGRVVFLFQPGEEALAGAQAMISDGVLERTRPDEIHALHCGPFPVGTFAVTPGTGLPGLDHGSITLTGPGASDRAEQLVADISALSTVAYPQTSADLERLVQELETPHGPLARFVWMRAGARPAANGDVEVRVMYRCWPQERVPEIRDRLRRLTGRYPDAHIEFPTDAFPAMVCPPRPGREVRDYLARRLGRPAVTTMHAAIPFSGEDFALFLRRVPGTFSFLGVRRPGADITTAYPHFGAFDPDERAIGVGVRAMAGWLAHRTGTGDSMS
ncbi:M20 metallopeptidase family protein [Actinoallomurus sp. CA-150999]|uniref:M20 metallopeptidase family protein n=1 Tax=Actinoallomurus sp. CA-150999 TaxID=3239887 RepID=UPI003D900BE3